MNRTQPDDLESRILQLLDGELEGDALTRLDAEMQDDPDARALYLRMAVLHSALQDHYLSREEFPHMPIISIERLLSRQRRRAIRLSMMAAAAVILISGITLWMNIAAAPSEPLARFRTAPGTTFTLTHTTDGKAPPGNALQAGSRLRVETGVIEFTLDTGTHCVIKAPSTLEIVSSGNLRIKEGVAWCKVPPAAVGFTIETPRLKIIDLGTEFGVLASADAPHEVHVFAGKVEVSRRDNGEKRMLLAGHALTADANGALRETTADPTRFNTTLPDAIAIRNPGFDLIDDTVGHHDARGYGPIIDWATSSTGIGTSSEQQPFLNQPAHSGTRAAFIQGSGMISQSVGGFDPSKLYTVTYFVSERGLPGAATRTSVSLDLGSSAHAPPEPIIKTAAFRRIVSGPLSVFGPTANIQISATTASGDAALLVDSVGISRAVPAIADGGFENPVQESSQFKQATGTGGGELQGSTWDFHAGGGILANGSVFLSPDAPEGSQAAVLQSERARIGTTVHGFEDGVTYTLSLEAAGRRHGGAAPLRVMLDGKPITFASSPTLTPSIGSYTTFTSDGFIPGKETLHLRIEATGAGTTFIDDLRFNFVAEASDMPADGK